MSFRTREQIAKDRDEKSLKAGVYPFQVNTAIEGPSKKGAHMVSLELTVWDEGNRMHTVKDWLGEWTFGDEKFLGFCEATGQPETYDGGKIRAIDCVDKQGYVVIKIETSDQYGDRPKVGYYVPKGDETSVKDRFAKKQAKQIPAEKFYNRDREAVTVNASEVGSLADLVDDLPF